MQVFKHAPVSGLLCLFSLLSTWILLPQWLRRLQQQVENNNLINNNLNNNYTFTGRFSFLHLVSETFPFGLMGTNVIEIVIKLIIFVFVLKKLENKWGSYYFFTVWFHSVLFSLAFMHLFMIPPLSLASSPLEEVDRTSSFYFYYYNHLSNNNNNNNKVPSTSQLIYFHNYNLQYLHCLCGGASLMVLSVFIFRYISEMNFIERYNNDNNNNNNRIKLIIKRLFQHGYGFLVLLLGYHNRVLFSTLENPGESANPYNNHNHNYNNYIKSSKRRNININNNKRGSELILLFPIWTRLLLVLASFLFSRLTNNLYLLEEEEENNNNNNNKWRDKCIHYFEWFTDNISRKVLNFFILKFLCFHFMFGEKKTVLHVLPKHLINNNNNNIYTNQTINMTATDAESRYQPPPPLRHRRPRRSGGEPHEDNNNNNNNNNRLSLSELKELYAIPLQQINEILGEMAMAIGEEKILIELQNNNGDVATVLEKLL